MELEKALFLCLSAAELKNNGFEVRQTSDFGRVRRACDLLGKPYLTPFFDVNKSDLSAMNCFWIIVSRDSKPVALGGVRFDDMTGETVSDYWGRMFARHYAGGIYDVAKPLNDVIKGRTCYLGDLYVQDGTRGSLKLLSCAARMAHALANLRWNPDVTYSFLRKQDVDRGAAARYGYSTAIANSKLFLDPVFPRTNDEACAYLTREQYEHWVRSEVNN